MIAFEEIEKLAYLNQLLPKFASLPEQFAYLCMRSLYGDYRKRSIGKDQAQMERDRIRLAYENARTEESQVLELYRSSNEINVKLAGFSKLVETGACERCKTILRIWDGRMK